MAKRDPDLELHQLAADPMVAPPRVLLAEADDEGPGLRARSVAGLGDPSFYQAIWQVNAGIHP
jgi:hypothetical protein